MGIGMGMLLEVAMVALAAERMEVLREGMAMVLAAPTAVLLREVTTLLPGWRVEMLEGVELVKVLAVALKLKRSLSQGAMGIRVLRGTSVLRIDCGVLAWWLET